MRNTIKSELWKAVHNLFFYIAVFIGLSIALINAAENILIVRELTARTIEIKELGIGSGGHAGFSLFLLSLPYNGINFASRLYLLAWPLLAAMPYGWSYCGERRSGLYNQIVSRISPSKYYIAKYIAVFVSGGIAVFLPAAFDILINAMICPYEVMDVTHSIAPIFNGWFLSKLYYISPWVHALIWCSVLFLLGGSTATLCFCIGAKLKLPILVALIPFVILVLWDMVISNVVMPLIPNSAPVVLLSPLHMVIATSAYPNPAWVVYSSICILGILGFGIGYLQVLRNESV